MRAPSIDPSKLNLYKLIHKYLRSELNKITQDAGSTDLTNPEQKAFFFSRFKLLATSLQEHARLEDAHFHPLLKECGSPLLEEVEREHAKLDSDLEQLIAAEQQITNPSLTYQFYLDLIVYQTNYFSHLDAEETKLLPALHTHFDNDRLLFANQQVLRSMSRERMISVTKGMLPVINHQERVEVYSSMKKSGMPPEAFSGMCRLASTTLTPDEAIKLFEEIGWQDSSPTVFSATPATRGGAPVNDLKRQGPES